MDKKQCVECRKEINDIEPLQCGFCDAYMHINQTCCGINSRGLKEAFSQRKILLMCTVCKDKMNGRSISSYIADTHPMQPTATDPTELPVKVQQLSDVVEKLNKKIDVLARGQTQLEWPTPTPNTPVWSKRATKRRRVDENVIVQATSDCGTNEIDLSDLSVPSIVPVAPKVNKFWLYLSRLNPLVTDGDVQKIVSRCLLTSDTNELVRLVPRGKDVASLSFVSYKVGLDPDIKARALNPASWPVGLLFREFLDQPKNPLRQPSLVPPVNS